MEVGINLRLAYTTLRELNAINGGAASALKDPRNQHAYAFNTSAERLTTLLKTSKTPSSLLPLHFSSPSPKTAIALPFLAPTPIQSGNPLTSAAALIFFGTKTLPLLPSSTCLTTGLATSSAVNTGSPESVSAFSHLPTSGVLAHKGCTILA